MVAAAQQTLNELCLPVTVEQLTAIGAATLGAVIFIFAFMRKGKGTAKEDAMSFEVEYTPSTMEVLNQLSVEDRGGRLRAGRRRGGVIAALWLEVMKAGRRPRQGGGGGARAKWERVQAWREAERLNRSNTMIVAAGAEARTKAHTDESPRRRRLAHATGGPRRRPATRGSPRRRRRRSASPRP